ncbi:hypothetical protein [Streptosporangium subroseum]|uniref:hypothetical protein n=1 Tax=Streptosporangium subroseum TaxID=106412 RepID=UPI00308F0AF6|nr:hypothetical protein OHB15_13935 [Streptosporangium subroseum]
MNINHHSISAKNLGDTWEFLVKYTAEFLHHELHTPFKDAIRIMEREGADNYQGITDYAETLEHFTPTAILMIREKRIQVSSARLNTEWGVEEIAARIWLGNKDVPPGNRDEKYTPFIPIDPG